MTKTLYNKFDKSVIGQLPREEFTGRVFTILSEDEANRAVDYLMTQPVLGFDSETRPSFKRHVSHKVALLQVSTPDTCFLFRLNRIGLTDSLIQLLSDDHITKIGLSWNDDVRALNHRRAFHCGTFVELQQLVKQLGIEDNSLQKIYANLFGKKISKSQQLSNWEADSLSNAQVAYASLDAWACIKIYEEIERLKQTGDYIMITKNESETQDCPTDKP